MSTVLHAPNRSTEVANICRDHPEVFIMPAGGNAGMWATESDTRRRAFLIGTLIPLLNTFSGDGENWGCLIKDDQAGKIPADIIVWRPTLEHFDVLTDTGATWIPKGVLNNAVWRWGAVGASPVPAGGAGDGTSGQTPGVDINISTLIDDFSKMRQELRDFRASASLDAGVILDRIDEKFNAIISRFTTLEAQVNSHVFTAPDYEARIFGTRVRFTPVKKQ